MTEADRSFLRRVVFEETAKQLEVSVNEITEETIVPNVLSLIIRVHNKTQIDFDVKKLRNSDFRIINILKIFS